MAEIAIERYNINQNTWTALPLQVDGQPLKSLIGSGMTTDPSSEKIYILGGSDGALLQSTAFEIDSRAGSVKSLPLMLDARANTHASFCDKKIFAFVGLGSSGENHYLDLETNEWRDLDRKFESLSNLPSLDLHNNAGCFVELS